MQDDVTKKALSKSGTGSSVLDHASDFVELVSDGAPRVYELLTKNVGYSARTRGLNPGQLFVYAEYTVFKVEFERRFGDLGEPACINAFCRLFLKNDIALGRLMEAIEGKKERPDSHPGRGQP